MPTNEHLEVTTEAQFQERLTRLVRAAAANGVEVRGGWPVENPDESGYDLEIVETVAPADVSDEPTTLDLDDGRGP